MDFTKISCVLPGVLETYRAQQCLRSPPLPGPQARLHFSHSIAVSCSHLIGPWDVSRVYHPQAWPRKIIVHRPPSLLSHLLIKLLQRLVAQQSHKTLVAQVPGLLDQVGHVAHLTEEEHGRVL